MAADANPVTGREAPRPPATAAGSPESVRGWVHSRSFDLAMFTLSPLAGLLVIWANLHLASGPHVIMAEVYFIGIPHYLASFTFFLGDDNLANYRTRRLAFFVGPLIICLAVVVLRGMGFHGPVQSVMYVWNVYHVSLQSAGILGLYRRLNGGPLSERRIAQVAILAVNATLAFWYIDRFPPLDRLLAAVHPLAPELLHEICLPIAVAAVAVLLYRIAQRQRRISVPELSFLASSLLLFHPYLWVKDSNLATFGMLMGHFIQYLAIVWLLNERKYAASRGSWHERLLGSISASPIRVGAWIVGVGLTFYAFNRVSIAVGTPMVYELAWNSLILSHYYLDGLIWAFKRPFVRESIGPYLTPASHFAVPLDAGRAGA